MMDTDGVSLYMPAVLESITQCPCDKGCPCCVGKPLRQYTTWNVERGEASIYSYDEMRNSLRYGLSSVDNDLMDKVMGRADHGGGDQRGHRRQ